MREATHSKIVQFHEEIATAHLDINGFYRFNWSEISGKFRAGIATPALLLESHSFGIKPNSNNTTTFSPKYISFLLLDFTGKADNYTKQEEVLDITENIAIDIISYLKQLYNDKTSWLYGCVDLDSIECEKVGPIFDNMYGWNVKYSITPRQPLCFEPDKWFF
ncbi:hypothetical protein LXD69_10225 [Flavobacterium sediminilitoris]|uniref:Uncharacterized protein n=1 Tax=Flavobacterium sediminilitoris TaxID=2024526 RepID=A0ABY4HHW6_9FLAO|nr:MULTISPECIES: hypothetical protein [Flavobacterium]UOX32428.1 hypothetical protein LXD69_10225 [Flavobacterium sediminilitoris]